jgi:hypothetical protein
MLHCLRFFLFFFPFLAGRQQLAVASTPSSQTPPEGFRPEGQPPYVTFLRKNLTISCVSL